MGIFKTVFNHLFGSERTYEVKGLGIFTCKVCNWCQDESYTWSGMVKLPLYSKETVILMNGDASSPSPQQVSALWKLLESWKLIITQLDGMLHQESRFVHKDEIYASWQDSFYPDSIVPDVPECNGWEISFERQDDLKDYFSFIWRNNKVQELTLDVGA